jgi:glycerol-3-phosphate dehydrogenase (NAD+)
VVGQNVREHPDLFEDEVRMYVYEELVDGERYLTSIINTNHENVKYAHAAPLTSCTSPALHCAVVVA